MATAAAAILRSENCLRHHHHHQHYHFHNQSPPYLKAHRSPYPNHNFSRSLRRKRSLVASESGGWSYRTRSRGEDRVVPMVARSHAKNLVVGQVKILKRGEDFTKLPEKTTTAAAAAAAFAKLRYGGGRQDRDLVVWSTDRLGPEPETVQKQIRLLDLKVMDGLYAGSAAFLASPPPSSLPFPAFFNKEKRNDVATSDLRRLLRLDLI